LATEIVLPRVDMGMETGKISRWYVEAGAVVEKGQPLFEIETDKAAMEIEAPASGRLADPAACAVTLPVGRIVGWILAEGEVPPPSASGPSPVLPAGNAGPAPTVSPTAGVSAAVSSPPGPVSAPAEPMVSTAAAVAPSTAAATGALRATPLARRTARLEGIDLAALLGSGPRGRILRADVAAEIARRGYTVAEPIAAAPAPAGVSDDLIRGSTEADDIEAIPHDQMRRTIARRLVLSKQTIPHFYLSVDCTLDPLLALREEINAEAEIVDGRPAYRISVNDFVIKAMAVALRKVPEANVTWSDEALLRHAHADIGVAVAVPGGLVTPVVHRAEEKSLLAVSEEMRDFVARAKSRRLRPDEYRGGSTAISNLGMYGIRAFAAIIDPPQATILAVGAGEERVMVRDHQPAVATRMTVTLSTDHRAVDGALGAELLGAFKTAIEKPLAVLV
jgi:pyruvate dehydrogenase E2 component (dihydrolipoamide acetyltransferase)